MPKNNRGSSSNRGRNNNPEGRNQYSGGVTELARERPFTAALGAAAAVGAGVFLWSRRNQISDQISNLSEQIGEWTQNMNWGGSSDQFDTGDDTAGLTTAGTSSGVGTSGSTSRKGRTSTTAGRGMSETGGGNANLGAHSGGGGLATAPSGRGRSQTAGSGR